MPGLSLAARQILSAPDDRPPLPERLLIAPRRSRGRKGSDRGAGLAMVARDFKGCDSFLPT